jgi:uridine kinase
LSSNKTSIRATEFIIFDAPLGYRHKQTAKYIDFLVFPNTPPDIALSRRLLRDFRNKESASINDLLDEVEFYLSARELYTLCYEKNHDANLVVDGSLPVENQIVQILSAIEKFKMKGDCDD